MNGPPVWTSEITAMRRPFSSLGHFESDSVTGRTTSRLGSMKKTQIKQLTKKSKRETSVTRASLIHFGAFPDCIGPGERRSSCMRKNNRPRKTELKIKKLIVMGDQMESILASVYRRDGRCLHERLTLLGSPASCARQSQ